MLDSKGTSVESDPSGAEDSVMGSATTELDGGLATGVKLGTAETNTLEEMEEKLPTTEGTVGEAVGMVDVVKGEENSEIGITVEKGFGESEGFGEGIGVAEKKETPPLKEATPVGMGEMMVDTPLSTSVFDEGRVDAEVITLSLLGKLLDGKVRLAVTVTVVCAIVIVTVLAVASTGRTEALREGVADAATEFRGQGRCAVRVREEGGARSGGAELKGGSVYCGYADTRRPSSQAMALRPRLVT